MATGQITNSLIVGLTAQMVQARVNTADASKFYFGTHFPVKRVNGFSWRMLENQLEGKNVAADIHTDNGTIVRKRRPIFDVAQGDIPYIAVSREMTRKDLKDYQTALALTNDADASKLVEYWGGDVDFCFNAVQSEIEKIAFQTLSHAGVFKADGKNSASFEANMDYMVDDDKKVATTSDWTQKSSDIIADFVKLVKSAKDMNLSPKFAFVNLDTFYAIASNESVIKACASYLNNLANIPQTPDLATVNVMLSRQAWLNGIQLRVIDQTITTEFADGTQKSENPFADNVLVLSESERLGTTQYDILAENNPAIIRAERAHCVIKKYGTCEPTAEITIGQADALPVLDSAYRNLYVKVDGNNDFSYK